MPPKGKDKDAAEDKILLGRPGNNLRMGLVGLPTVGRTTLYNVMTKSTVSGGNFSVDSHEARVMVPDSRVEWMTELYKPQKSTHAYLTCVHIAGLVRGASAGEGLGNAFLSHIQAADGLYQVLRAFESSECPHIEETVDPIRDLQTVRDELIAKDVQRVEKEIETLTKDRKGLTGVQQKKREVSLAVCDKLMEALKAGKQIRFLSWTTSEVEVINSLFLLTAKPSVFLINVSEKDFLRKKNKFLLKIKTWVDENCPGEPIIPFSGEFERKLADMPEDEAKAYEEKVGGASVMSKIIKMGCTVLKMLNFFTVGPDEVKAWTVREGTKVPQAGGVIHSDLERGFICAETFHYDDLVAEGDEKKVKESGKFRQEGKGYVMTDGDIIHIKFNVTAPKKKK